ncbi:hypothetical protein GN956_G16013 [Arapaima gigas]
MLPDHSNAEDKWLWTLKCPGQHLRTFYLSRCTEKETNEAHSAFFPRVSPASLKKPFETLENDKSPARKRVWKDSDTPSRPKKDTDKLLVRCDGEARDLWQEAKAET